MTDNKNAKKPKEVDIVRESRITADDYFAMPDDGLRYELVDGILELMSPGPNMDHQIIIRQLSHLLSLECAAEYEIVTSPIDLQVSQSEVRQPDLIMFHLSHVQSYRKRGRIGDPPELVVEVLSPSSIRRDKVDKLVSYARFGVPEYWIISQEKGTLEQYVLSLRGEYCLERVYKEGEPIQSTTLHCVTFSITDVLSRLMH